jgi:hypothetical protein
MQITFKLHSDELNLKFDRYRMTTKRELAPETCTRLANTTIHARHVNNLEL